MANYITAAGESLTLPEGFENYSVKDSNTNTEKIAKILNAQDNRLNEIEKNTDKIDETINTIIGKNGDDAITSLADLKNYINTETSNRIKGDDDINNKIGTMDDLTTTEKNTLVGSINELDSNIGSLDDLETKESRNIVGAINELKNDMNEEIFGIDGNTTSINNKIGNMNNLTTTEKTNLVGSINELDSNIGSLDDLNDSIESDESIVGAINSIMEQLSSNKIDSDDFNSNIDKTVDSLRKQFRNILLIDKDNIDKYVQVNNDNDDEVVVVGLKNILMLYKGIYTNINATISTNTNTSKSMTLYIGLSDSKSNTVVSLDSLPLNIALSFNKYELNDAQPLIMFSIFPDRKTLATYTWMDDDILPYFGNTSDITYWTGVYNLIKEKLTTKDIGLDDELDVIDERINSLNDNIDNVLKDVNDKLENIGEITITNMSSLNLQHRDGEAYHVEGNIRIRIENNGIEKFLNLQGIGQENKYDKSSFEKLYVILTVNPYNNEIITIDLCDKAPYPSYSNPNEYLKYYNFKRMFRTNAYTSKYTFRLPIAEISENGEVSYYYKPETDTEVGATINSTAPLTEINENIMDIMNMDIENHYDPMAIMKCEFKQNITKLKDINSSIKLDFKNCMKVYSFDGLLDLDLSNDSNYIVEYNSDPNTIYGYIWLKPVKTSCYFKYTEDLSQDLRDQGYINVGSIMNATDSGNGESLLLLTYANDLYGENVVPQTITVTIKDLLDNITTYLRNQIINGQTINANSIMAKSIETKKFELIDDSGSKVELNANNVDYLHDIIDADIISKTDNVYFGEYTGIADGSSAGSKALVKLDFIPVAVLIMDEEGRMFSERETVFEDTETDNTKYNTRVSLCRGGLAFRDKPCKVSMLYDKNNSSIYKYGYTDDYLANNSVPKDVIIEISDKNGEEGFYVYSYGATFYPTGNNSSTRVVNISRGTNTKDIIYRFIAWKSGDFDVFKKDKDDKKLVKV